VPGTLVFCPAKTGAGPGTAVGTSCRRGNGVLPRGMYPPFPKTITGTGSTACGACFSALLFAAAFMVCPVYSPEFHRHEGLCRVCAHCHRVSSLRHRGIPV